MFYIPDFKDLDELIEYEQKFLEKFKKSINSSAYNQMLQIKNEIDMKKKEFFNNKINDSEQEFNNYLNIG